MTWTSSSCVADQDMGAITKGRSPAPRRSAVLERTTVPGARLRRSFSASLRLRSSPSASVDLWFLVYQIRLSTLV